MGTSPKPLRTMNRVLFVALLAYISHGAPLEGFGDATDAEIEEIRAGTYLEMFDENPTYNYNYKVADDVEQTYLSLEEARNDGVVTGMYSYVDPLGSLITVKYTAGAMGYTEERTEQPNFVSINPRPVSASSSSSSSSSGSSSGSGFSSSGSSTGSSSSSGSSSSLFSGSSSLSSGSSSQSSGSSSSSLDQSSLVSRIVAQIQPLVSQTVTSAVAGQSSNTGGQSTTSPTSGQSSSSLSSSSGQDSLLILSPGSTTTTTSTSSTSDLVAQILAQIGPLVSQTVSSVVSSGSQASTSPARVSSTSPVALAPAPQARTLVASGSQDKETLFGSSGDVFNVKINHAGANIEY